jgi:ABC-type proline/glycine betaine transport system ATPase subunit
MLMVTHDIAEASVMGTQIGVLDAGSLIAWDRPDAIWRSTDSRVRRLLDAVPAVPVRG